MDSSKIGAEIERRLKAKMIRPVLIEGSPGLGKTAIVEQTAKRLGVGFMKIHAPLMQPEDYGLPVPNADRTSIVFLVAAAKFPFVDTDCAEEGILLIDEFNQAGPEVQKILANLLHASDMNSREIHGKRLKPGWVIVCTGNRATDRAGANRLLSHVRDRVTPVTFDANLGAWTSWALSNNVRSELIAFLNFKPGLLTTFNGQSEFNATPRSWVEGISPIIGTSSPDVEFELMRSEVGEGPAAEFTAFLKVFREMPSIPSILLNPDKVEVPKEVSTLYALTLGLADHAKEGNMDRVFTYLKRFPKDRGAEFRLLFAKAATTRDTNLTNTKAFIDWYTNEGSKLQV